MERQDNVTPEASDTKEITTEPKKDVPKKKVSTRKKKKKKIKARTLITVIFIVVVAFLGLNVLFAVNGWPSLKDLIKGREGTVTTISNATIYEVLEIRELQTADYIYNAVTQVYEEDGETLKYYVAYNGRITAGIDFGEIVPNVDEESKIITVTIPQVTIQDAIVESGSLEYIFENKTYDTENTFAEAYSACQADLNERAENEAELKDLAQENAKSIVEALVSPWVEQVDSEYTVEIVVQEVE